MKKVAVFFAMLFVSLAAQAQFSVIRGINPSQQFVNLNADTFGNIAVNCVIGCGASSGTAGVIANGASVTGINPLLVGGSDGTSLRTLNTDASGHQNINIINTPAVTATISGTPAVTATITGTPAVTASITGTPTVSISNTPAVTLASTTLSGTSNNVVLNPSTNTLVDKSGTITTGGTSQTLSTAKSRHYLFVQNLSTANLYINFTSAASAGSGSIVLLPNSSFVQEGAFVSSELVTVFGATTGQAFTAKEF